MTVCGQLDGMIAGLLDRVLVKNYGHEKFLQFQPPWAESKLIASPISAKSSARAFTKTGSIVDASGPSTRPARGRSSKPHPELTDIRLQPGVVSEQPAEPLPAPHRTEQNLEERRRFLGERSVFPIPWCGRTEL
ncbi:hypothetical protein [Limnoglobus roseus]|uniref:hypothetical protein n=1 Tax=Limnoglobus roseus TaxID=2598579 RepID=UPI001FE88F6C|nr:hypothetical protein [Limnoglobus roseus]